MFEWIAGSSVGALALASASVDGSCGSLSSPSLDSTGTLGAAEAQTKEIPPVLLLIDSKRRMYSGGAPMHRPASLRGHLPLRPQPPYGRSSPR